MAVKYTQEELELKVKRVHTIREQLKKLEDEEAILKIELLSVATFGKKVPAGAWAFTFKEQASWMSFNAERAAEDYPMQDFPQIYLPTYALTKHLLGQLNDSEGEEVENYCSKSARLYLSKPRTTSTRYTGKRHYGKK